LSVLYSLGPAAARFPGDCRPGNHWCCALGLCYRIRNALSGALAVDRRTGVRRSHRRHRPGFGDRHFQGGQDPGLVLIECESLFNDGTAAVAFGVLVALALGQQLTPVDIAATLLKTVWGGILCGAPAGRADRRSPRRNHVHHRCRLRVVPTCGPFRVVWGIGHDHRGACHEQFHVFRNDL